MENGKWEKLFKNILTPKNKKLHDNTIDKVFLIKLFSHLPGGRQAINGRTKKIR
ncbi:MAG: hypothetical protein KKH32_04805 [Bacteroidetes bacterium]|nr:hypothetical protein [Bacteroidota bacterium]